MRFFPQLSHLMDYIAHRRMTAFWALSLIALLTPWAVPGVTSPQRVTGDGSYDRCLVLNVHDGDTLTVSCQGEKIRVRLYCIDAPELGQEPWGREARDYLRSITGPTVRLDVKDRDRYGRVVADVQSAGVSVNRDMISAGKAVVYGRYCNDRQMYRLEEQAKRQSRGVWSQPGDQQRPWAWRS